MRWQATALAIMCVPCRRIGGHFHPTDELVLASLDGERPHPVHELAALLRSDRAGQLRDHGVEQMVVAVDDLAVDRSWMLPPDAPPVERLWPRLHTALGRVLNGSGLPCRIVRWSDLVQTAAYESRVREIAQACLPDEPEPQSQGLHLAMGQEIARRLRFERITGCGDTPQVLRRRAANQVANYAAQGAQVHTWQVGAYLPWTEQETTLMSLVEPGFTSRVAAPTYGGHAPVTSWDRFPDAFSGLVAELRLYDTDQPDTPGAVRPGLAEAVLDALADLITPGTHETGLRRLRALNQVLSAGARNRNRVEELLARAATVERAPNWVVQEVVKKLYCQLTSRYTDEEDRAERVRHHRIVADLTRALPVDTAAHVGLALTGSLTVNPHGVWHPFFSDIDVMPLFATTLAPDLVARIRAAYSTPERPAWVHLNEGARAGVAGMTHDPATGMFVADRLHTLTTLERAKLGRLVSPMRHVGGDREVFDVFVRAHAGLTTTALSMAAGEGTTGDG
ncbi:hypothetical protein PWG71_01880 [Nocardiopsis sp. N85]|uniref:hypothetical protein n=1 Tax=Nocardiopsis sp. N85 TaxID=3029400 RepID=UPI00237F9A47|nr:hypothetical protein [Nocardiopsis sp. N85]MDE3720121.1 hypothetical protein [Nocardiopsis sp. N85]